MPLLLQLSIIDMKLWYNNITVFLLFLQDRAIDADVFFPCPFGMSRQARGLLCFHMEVA